MRATHDGTCAQRTTAHARKQSEHARASGMRAAAHLGKESAHRLQAAVEVDGAEQRLKDVREQLLVRIGLVAPRHPRVRRIGVQGKRVQPEACSHRCEELV
jgi:hypothetical protein